MQPTPSRKRKSGLQRYAPFAIVVVVIAAIVLIAGNRNGGDDSGAGGGADQGSKSNTQLIEAGPMTPDKAELLGETVDFGDGCDTSTGRVKIPSWYAPTCVAPFRGSNGGATAPGVTAETIKVIVWIGDPSKDPLQAALVRSAGSDTDVRTAEENYRGWIDLYSQYAELYGRRIEVSFFKGSGAPSDPVAAKADAQAIIDQQPFAVLGGPNQTDAFADEITAAKIMCMGCSTASPTKFMRDRAPYIWTTGQLPEQASTLAAEMIGNLFAGRKAQWAGDPALRSRTRVFGAVHYDTPAGQQREAFRTFKSLLAERDIELASDTRYYLDLARAQENARTIIAKLKAAKVTSVIFYGDPLTPSYLTKEATAQDYRPEWIIGPSVYADTAVFGRIYDQDQWQHAFGLSLIPARSTREASGAYKLWTWQFGTPPPNNNYAVHQGPVSLLMTGINLAGPNLTPETFRDGMFRSGIAGGNPLAATISFGKHGIWPNTSDDLGGADDGTLIWWNPTAKGFDEIGNDGTGLYEYVDGGTRYRPGDWPTSDPGIFDPAKSVTIYESVPPEYLPPQYPSPAGR